MNILFITSNRLGDAVLSTGVLDHLIRTEPEARITVACGPLVARLFEMAPRVDQVIALPKQSWNRHWFDLWRQTVGTRWDMVVDLRNSAVSRFIRSKKRYIWSSLPEVTHKVEQVAAVLGLNYTPAPTLWFDDEIEKQAAQIMTGERAILAVGPAANWPGKTWAPENFIELIGRLNFRSVAVIAAPGEESIARPVLESVPEAQRIDLIAKGDPALAAACLKRCALYVGNDSGLMHCAAAVGVPTLGLFGPSYPHLYRPWGTHTSYVSTPETYDELINFDGYDPKAVGSLMTSLSVDVVESAARKLIR